MFYLSHSGLLFFFFKQKTAYEMRISDWSSDVCSSDLAQGPERLDHGAQPRLVIAEREIGAADRAREQHVADQRQLRGRVMEDDVAGGVAGRVIGDRKSTSLNSSH